MRLQSYCTFHWFYHNFTGMTKEDKKDTERKPLVLLYLGVTNTTNEIRMQITIPQVKE
jgi:hypothetical protein